MTLRLFSVTAVGLMTLVTATPAADTVATAIYARIGNGYSRQLDKAGRFKPEYYALANGGRISGTTGDLTVDRVTYPQVAEIAMRLLQQQNYHYAENKEQAKLLLVLYWGNTIAFDRISYDVGLNSLSAARNALGPQGAGNAGSAMQGSGMDGAVGDGSQSAVDRRSKEEDFESEMLRLFMQNRSRDEINGFNAQVLGYLDELNEANDIRRWAGGGDRYGDLIGDVEETRYYIVISAYDFKKMTTTGEKVLLWQTRVSVRSPGNSFDDSYAAMLKSASKYFGQDHRRLIRDQETKGTVELGDLKFLGEVKAPAEQNQPQVRK